MQWCGIRRLSVCPSVNFCANRFFSHANGRVATKHAHDGLQGVLKVKVKVKGHVIRALCWILGISYSVTDGLVIAVSIMVYLMSVMVCGRHGIGPIQSYKQWGCTVGNLTSPMF